MFKNKKLIISFVIIICILVTIGLAMLIFNNEEKQIGDNQNEKQFKAKIIEVYSNGNIVVEPNENEDERKTSDKISVTGKSDIQWQVGKQVIITYNGEIMESYPAQIHAINIELDSE